MGLGLRNGLLFLDRLKGDLSYGFYNVFSDAFFLPVWGFVP